MLDFEVQISGCRQKYPDICDNNSVSDVCAFATDYCIFLKPSRTQKLQYKILKVQAAK